MAALRAVAVAATLLAASPAQADPVARWQAFVAEASQRFGIPEDWIYKVMRAESGGRTVRNGKPIRSRVGAMGLMQIMPGTWAELRTRYALGSDPDDPRANILGGTAYLREMYELFGYPGLFAAYNAGPARYAAYRAGRSRLPGETIAYVAGITGGRSSTPAPAAIGADKGVQLATAPPRPTLFVTARSNADNIAAPTVSRPTTSLFVSLGTAQREAE